MTSPGWLCDLLTGPTGSHCSTSFYTVSKFNLKVANVCELVPFIKFLLATFLYVRDCKGICTPWRPIEFQSPPPWAAHGRANVPWWLSGHYFLCSLRHLLHLRNISSTAFSTTTSKENMESFSQIPQGCQYHSGWVFKAKSRQKTANSINHNFWPLFLHAPVVKWMPISSKFTGFHRYTVSMIHVRLQHIRTVTSPSYNDEIDEVMLPDSAMIPVSPIQMGQCH